MSENEMPERIWIEGPCVVTNDPSDQKYYVHEDKYDYLTDDYLTEYHRTPSLPDVMEDGYVLAECVGIKWVVEIYDFLFVVALDTGVGRIAMSPEEAAKLGAPDLSKYHVQNNQIVKVEG